MEKVTDADKIISLLEDMRWDIRDGDKVTAYVLDDGTLIVQNPDNIR